MRIIYTSGYNAGYPVCIAASVQLKFPGVSLCLLAEPEHGFLG